MNYQVQYSLDFKTKIKLLCGAITAPFFSIVVLVQGWLRSGYSSFLYPLSSLSIGASGWIQIANFIFTGLLFILFSSGLKKVLPDSKKKFNAPLFITLAGIGLIGAGIFVTDPLFGYPQNNPLILKQFTWHGHLHDTFSMLLFVCLTWTCFKFQKFFFNSNEKGWAKYSAFTGYFMVITFIMASIGFRHTSGFVNFAGLFQRLCVFSGMVWVALLSIHFFKKAKCKLNTLSNMK